ncbi:carboxymuconolactone decarboxylase family protein [Burkholderia glumae]|uniref:Carboxymuconolactone decarboxylase family protein n=1 Tax=Burkholderia glumae TaxID=337 RepID=A0AAQ0BWM1_BURGL|nr:carboxymuconolactone decarboxylase family protein [Burkholderia glumae]ACR32750.1 Alkylhydroperoxidase [Burkholderia glumae BGR1]AJY62316.1 alkylhydroperoxidase AhpD family core domain protein [Burkholderia glumae LMG 2196 = ATCC 33617]KHJ64938.1 alkylhydroperoxidase [Burkholderia glumae]MCM2485755.1 carboxymuconolactone decarboxylase family protein [Burkholderia glumae]MCM2511593.1 carboxymuconolactone decarboxylase family protein [Burkholderia glumae]
MNQTARLSLSPVSAETAQGRTKEVLDTARQQVGFIPNMYAGMANFPAVLDTYLHGYKLFRTESALTPAEQETVFLAISRANECTYCMAAHSMIATAVSKTPVDVVQAIRSDSPIDDPKLAALAEFTRLMVMSRGRPTSEQLSAFVSAGYTEHTVLEIILAIAVKTLSNYSNHVFHTEVDQKFQDFAWAPPTQG